MIPYLLHSSILLTGCFLFYWIFIRNETFFHLNRWVLIASVLLSVGIPMITVPESWSIRTIDKSELMIPEVPVNEVPVGKKPEHPLAANHFDNKAHQSQHLDSAEMLPLLIAKEATPKFTISFPTLLWYIYLIGVSVFLLAFLLQLLILITKMYTLISFKDGRYRIVELVKDEAPYSFWNTIFIHPGKYDLDTYTQIIDHEKIHIQQAHFVDKLIAEFLLIAFWFNPFVWLLRNAITNNLEYLTDSSMLQQGVEKQRYQLSLLQVSVPQHPLNLSTNYNNSFLKNRITMMNTKKSSARSSWKYFFLLPLLGLSIVCLNEVQSKAIETEKPVLSELEQPPLISNDSIPVKEKTLVSTKEEINYNNVSSSTSSTLMSGNETDLITASTVIITSTDMAVHSEIEHMMHMENFSADTWNNDLQPGHWDGEIDGDKVCFQINNSSPAKNSNWMSHKCFKKTELSDIPMETDKDFYIKRAAGTLNFNGSFSGNFGSGTFTFKEDATFRSYLKTNGMEIKKDREILHLFLNNVNKDYINHLTAKGFKPDGRDLVELSVHNIDKDKINDFVRIFEELDYKGYTVRDLIQLEIHDVDPAYVNEIRAQGLTDLTVQDIVQAKIHDLEPTFIKSVRDYGLDVDLQEVIQFSIHDVDVEYIEKMKNLGFKTMSHADIIQSSIHDVTPEYITAINDAGFAKMSMNDLIQFSIHDIDAQYIKGFKEAGLTNISQNDIIQAGIHDVDIDFVKAMQDYGFKDMDMNEIIQLAIHDVDVEYLKEMKALGFRDLDNNEITQAKIHNVKPSYIKELKEQGLESMDMRDIIQFSIHGIKVKDIKAFKNAGFNFGNQDIIQAGIHNVSASYVTEMRALGFKEAQLEELIQARIHGVSPDFVKRARDKGHDLKTLQEYIHLKIHGM